MVTFRDYTRTASKDAVWEKNCVIEIGFSWRGKFFFFPYSISRCSTRSHISGNRGYDSNRACYHYCFWFSTSVLFDLYSVQNLKASPALAAIFIHSVANSNASHWISQRCNIVRKSALVPEFACAALNYWSELINGPRCSCTTQTSSAVLSRLCFFSRLFFLISNRNGSTYELGNTMVPPVRPLTKFCHNGRKNGCKMQPFGLTLEPCGESIILHRNLAANIT